MYVDVKQLLITFSLLFQQQEMGPDQRLPFQEEAKQEKLVAAAAAATRDNNKPTGDLESWRERRTAIGYR